MTAGPTVVFRCNAGSRVGIGHLMRCRQMARSLQRRGGRSIILGPPTGLRVAQDADLFVEWRDIPDRGSSVQDAARVVDACAAHGAHHAVMDDYRIDPPYQHVLRGAGLRWLQQFDASTPFDYWCDVLVNASPFETRDDYLPWLKRPDAQRTLFGPSYAVLRPDFAALSVRPDGRPVRRILVAFGGGDDRGALSLGLTALAGRFGPNVILVLVAGKANPNHAALAAQIATLPRGQAELHVDPADMPRLMASCDLAVIAGGTMSYEAAICGLPMVFVGLAANQERPCRGWVDLTGAAFLGTVPDVTAQAVHDAVAALVADRPARTRMAAAGRAVVDGKGADRLLDALLKPSATIP